MPATKSQLPSDAIRPPVGDGSGYYVRQRDLRFLDIGAERIGCWQERTAPLGMSEIQYRAFVEQLCRALQEDGVCLSTCDVRLKGSSAEFFSGHHKHLPRTQNEVTDLFRELRDRYPEEWEVMEIMERLTKKWINDHAYPHRCPFDSIFRLGIAREPSDVDVQISDDGLVKRCEDLLTSRRQSPTNVRLRHSTYNFVRKDLIAYVCPSLYLFSLRMSDGLGRHVSIAVFPSAGPPNTTTSHGKMSAHLRSEDWRIEIEQLQSEVS